jgi:hypothetical protein
VESSDVAETKGLVQKLKLNVGTATFVYIGPSPTNTSALFVTRAAGDTAEQASVKDDMVAALASAMVARREVVAIHANTSSEVTGLRIDPV